MSLGDHLQGMFSVRSYFRSGQADKLPKGREKHRIATAEQ